MVKKILHELFVSQAAMSMVKTRTSY